LVERFFNKIKQCRRVATRYDKLAANYLAFIQLASIRLWLRVYESTPWKYGSPALGRGPVRADAVRDRRPAGVRVIKRLNSSVLLRAALAAGSAARV